MMRSPRAARTKPFSTTRFGAPGSPAPRLALIAGACAAVWSAYTPRSVCAQDVPPSSSIAGDPAPLAEAQSPEVRVRRFVARFDRDLPGLPDADELLREARPALALSDSSALRAPASAEGLPAPRGTVSLEELNASGIERSYSRQALEEVTRSLVQAMSARGFLGVLAAIEPDDLAIEVTDQALPLSAPANNWRDVRAAGATDLRIVLYAARVVQVRTIASGTRFPPEANINNPAHARILSNSPVVPAPAPGAPGQQAPEGADLLRRDLLDHYTLRLNRHPGRRVDAAVSAAPDGEVGDVTLDYLVREFKPWTLYFQVANNGTRQTDEIRERFGFVHNQLTNNDDQLLIDYVTAGFDQAHAVSVSYDFPIGERLRVRPFGSYSSFDASQVGQGDAGFTGESYAGGVESSLNVFQQKELFIDITGGARWESIWVNNETAALSGRDQFLIPSLGARLDRRTDESSSGLSVRLETNLDQIAGTGDPSLEVLGRTDADAQWWAFQWSADHSFFLEPLLDPTAFRAGRSTLAHELALSARGQFAFDHRLAPNFQEVIGGASSVRGYPESVVAGDDSVVGTIEYRLHIPSLLEPYDERDDAPPKLFGSDFRLRPSTRYVRADWDLIAKAFLDVGRTENSDRLAFEQDQTLLGTGVGLELLIGRNINIRGDFGVALEEVEQPTRVTEGSSRLHFAVTILF